jgi:hypothetical protein
MTEKLIPFNEFIKSLHEKKVGHFKSNAGFMVKNDHEFEKMNQHLINHYKGVEAVHSFKDQSGQVWDCIPIEKQPSIKRSSSTIPQPPDLQSITPKENGKKGKISSFLNADLKDDEGNMMNCPKGYIPVRRITLEELTRFETLENFFQKGPRGKGRHPRLTSLAAADENIHKYAHAFQTVDNLGGHSFLNIWQPKLSGNEVFSLSQHWYSAGSDAQLQTVEAGWQVFPQKYHGSLFPCLFIYWTTDGYQHTGNYNLDAAAFVQTNNNWALGGTFQNMSIKDGQQIELELTWELSDGNWWLFLDGLASENAIGYYPASIYNNGPISTLATGIDYGGETVGSTSWPEMGSGEFADRGWQKAAYQRNIFYYKPDRSTAWADLTPSQLSPACYTIEVKNISNWGESFFYGGPGGTGC